MDCLIGHTGFVGRNLMAARRFHTAVNSATVGDIVGGEFELVVCAAPHAKKWWANQNPAEDEHIVRGLAEVLSTLDAQRVVLLSTIDVLPRVTDIDDGFDGPWEPNHAYGRHRRALESLVESRFGARATVVRLPALFGPHLAKNVVFDLMNARLLDTIQPDSRFQWYDVRELWDDVTTLVTAGVSGAVLATEPVATRTLLERFFSHLTVGSAAGPPVLYDVHTRHGALFGRTDPYVRGADQVLESLEDFLAHESDFRSGDATPAPGRADPSERSGPDPDEAS